MAGVLTGSTALRAASVDFSSPVQTDWIQFPKSATAPNRKNGGGSTIGLPVAIGPESTYGGDPGTFNGVTWSDGTPVASATNDADYIYAPNSNGVANTGDGFQIVLPADTNQRTATIVWDCFGGNTGTIGAASQIMATLSDGSAAVLTLPQATPGVSTSGLYVTTLTYSAASAGQTLTIAITLTTNATGQWANIVLMGVSYLTAIAPATGSGSSTQAANVSSASAAPLSSASGASTQARNASAATGLPVASGAGSSVQASETANGTAATVVNGAGAAITQAVNVSHASAVSGLLSVDPIIFDVEPETRQFDINAEARIYTVNAVSTIPPKNAAAVLDYAFNWASWLAVGESISTAEVTVPEGLTVQSAAAIEGGLVVFWLAGGTPQVGYLVTCVITTSEGRTDSRAFTLRVI